MIDVFLAAPTACDELRQLFLDACARPSSIHQHLTVLRDTASGCKHITELGCGECNSTLAWLLVQPDRLIVVDHGWQEEIEVLKRLQGRTKLIFILCDDRDIEIEPTDLLFIDTEHNYEQLSAEFRLHAGKVRKYIVLHDTTTFANVGESPGQIGIWPAVEDFLRAHPEWKLLHRHHHNNGLTILEKVA